MSSKFYDEAIEVYDDDDDDEDSYSTDEDGHTEVSPVKKPRAPPPLALPESNLTRRPNSALKIMNSSPNAGKKLSSLDFLPQTGSKSGSAQKSRNNMAEVTPMKVKFDKYAVK
jgi:hypothetical protein